MIRTVLFDLDGTLADTAPDLAYALNRTLVDHGETALPFERIRPVVSHGGRALIELGFGLAPEEPRFEPLRQHLLAIYRDNIARETRLFPGMDALLQGLEQNGLRWGVVTNKPSWLTLPLMEGLGLDTRAATIVSGDTLPQNKPHPAPMLHACSDVGCSAADCLYVGDAERDVIAGRSAGMRTLVALFGYLAESDRPDQWGADGLIATPGEVLDWVKRFAA